MNGQTKIVVVFIASSVVAMYIETILQIYVCFTSEKTSVSNNSTALASLSLTLLSYLMSSIMSAFIAHSTMRFDGNLRSKVIFIIFHVIFLGLLWRIFKIMMSYTKSDIKDLAIVRLVHVGLQSGPYFIIYSSIFVTAGKISTVQVLSLSSSAISTVLAVTCFNLRLKLCDNEGVEGKSFGCSRMHAAIIYTFIGTLLVISARFTSLSLMASQEPHWIFLPLGCHILALFVIFIGFSSRLKAKTKTLPTDFIIHCVWAVGMSIVNCFDLVHDNIQRVMCKYVGFYSLFLVENIVFLSFWLLRFDAEYIGKLFSVVGILIGFVVGLMIKFAGCNMMQENMASTFDSPAHATVLTISNVSSSLSKSKTLTNGDDLVSIVQASVYRQSLQTDSLPQNSKRKKIKSAESGIDMQSQRLAKKDYEQNRRLSTELAMTSLRKERSQTSRDMPLRFGLSADDVFRQENDSNPANKIDLDNSFQPDSMFNVSDPGTIRSDMMYDDNNLEDVDDPRKMRDLRQLMNMNDFLNHASRISSLEQMGKDAHRSGAIESGHVMNQRGRGKLKQLQNQNSESMRKKEAKNFMGASKIDSVTESMQPNECSDTAHSSAKTFPMESKKADLKSYDNVLMYKSSLGRRMNRIIYSLEDTDKMDVSVPKLNIPHLPFNAPNSDDDIFRYKYNSGAFHTPRNRISYTDGDDLSLSENPLRMQHVESKNNITSLGRDRKFTKLPKHDSQPQSNISTSVILSPSALRLCESGSSSFSSMSIENKGYTKTSTSSSSSSSASTKHLCWADSSHQGREDLFLPDEESKLPSSENILRWLAVAGTDETDNEQQV